jgi:hypothetical protein
VNRLRAAGLVAAALVLGGCTAPRPDVTFYANRAAIAAQPALWCQVDTTALTFDCPQPDARNVARLTVHAGDPVQVNVPTEVGDGPWLIYFQYLDRSDLVKDGRTAVFDDGRLAYTLRPLDVTDQLLRVEVQTGILPTADGYAASRSWVLRTTGAAGG